MFACRVNISIWITFPLLKMFYITLVTYSINVTSFTNSGLGVHAVLLAS